MTIHGKIAQSGDFSIFIENNLHMCKIFCNFAAGLSEIRVIPLSYRGNTVSHHTL